MKNIYPFDFFLSGITIEFIVITIAIIIGILHTRQQRTLRLNFLDGLLCAFVLWYGGRLMVSTPHFNGWVLIQTIGCLFIYYFGRFICSEKFFFRLLFFTAISEAIWGILQWQGILPSYHVSFPATGSFFNPALWGIFCTCGLLAGQALFKKHRNIIFRILFLTGMSLLIIAIVLSSSRATWLAFATGICLNACTSNKGKAILHRLHYQHKNILYILIGITIIASAFIIYLLYGLRPESVQGRFLIWKVIATEIPNAILCGHGPLCAHYMPIQASWFESHPDDSASMLAGENIYAFNEFLQTTFEAGLIGLILLVWIVIMAFRKISDKDKNTRHASSIIVAVTCFGCFSYPFSSTSITTITILSLAIMARKLPTIEWTFPTLSRRLSVCGGILFLTYTLTIYAIAKRADLYLHKAQHHLSDLEKYKPIYYSRLQGNPDFMLAYGKLLYNREYYAEALTILQQASCLKPSCRLWCDIGDCHQHLNNFTAAEEAYRQAAGMIPSRIFPHYRLFNLYRSKGRLKQATEEATYMLTMPVKVVNTSVLRYRHQAKQFLNQHSLNPYP